MYITVTPSDSRWPEVVRRYTAVLGAEPPWKDSNALAVMSDAQGATDCLAMTLDAGDGFIWISYLIGPQASWLFLAKAGAAALAARTATTRHYRTTMPRALPPPNQRNAAETFLAGNQTRQLSMTWVSEILNSNGRWLCDGLLSTAVSRLASVVLP